MKSAGHLPREIPLGRYGKPEDLAKVVAFLCSNANTYLTGQVVVVDGGRYRSVKMLRCSRRRTMGYVFGIDAGGSSTICAGRYRRKLVFGQSGAANYKLVGVMPPKSTFKQPSRLPR